MEVDVFDAERKQLCKAEAAAVGHLCHEPRSGGHGVEQPLHFGRGQPGGQACGPFGARPFAEIAERLLQHIAIEEHDGVESLVLGGCGATWGEVFEVTAHAVFTTEIRAGADVLGKACDPASISVLCLPRKPPHAAGDANLFKSVSQRHGVVLQGLITLWVWIISVSGINPQ